MRPIQLQTLLKRRREKKLLRRSLSYISKTSIDDVSYIKCHFQKYPKDALSLLYFMRKRNATNAMIFHPLYITLHPPLCTELSSLYIYTVLQALCITLNFHPTSFWFLKIKLINRHNEYAVYIPFQSGRKDLKGIVFRY